MLGIVRQVNYDSGIILTMGGEIYRRLKPSPGRAEYYVGDFVHIYPDHALFAINFKEHEARALLGLLDPQMGEPVRIGGME